MAQEPETLERELSKQGIIYVLENKAFETPVVKIGRTGRTGQGLVTRIRTLNIAVPLPFTCYRASLVQDAVEVEKLLHQVFYPAKEHWSGEFYEVEPWRVVLVLQAHEIEDMTSHAPALSREEVDAVEATEIVKERRARFAFSEAAIPVGARLTLVGSDIECEVADESTSVLYEGQEYALSTLATRLKESAYWLQGVRYWEYEGETLLKRWYRFLDKGGGR